MISALDSAELTLLATPKITPIVFVAILTFAPTFTTLMISALALAELISLSIPPVNQLANQPANQPINQLITSSRLYTSSSLLQQASANPLTQTSLLSRILALAVIIEPASFKVQDLLKDPTFALAFTTPMVFAPALAELTLSSTPKIAPALPPVTCILTKP
jgi:hypothetical protein